MIASRKIFCFDRAIAETSIGYLDGYHVTKKVGALLMLL